MNVYVLTTGCYADMKLGGVFATPEAAMDSWRGRFVERHPSRDGLRCWTNDLDWDDYASIDEFRVEGLAE